MSCIKYLVINDTVRYYYAVKITNYKTVKSNFN